jgi:hypothetical protein
VFAVGPDQGQRLCFSFYIMLRGGCQWRQKGGDSGKMSLYAAKHKEPFAVSISEKIPEGET